MKNTAGRLTVFLLVIGMFLGTTLSVQSEDKVDVDALKKQLESAVTEGDILIAIEEIVIQKDKLSRIQKEDIGDLMMRLLNDPSSEVRIRTKEILVELGIKVPTNQTQPSDKELKTGPYTNYNHKFSMDFPSGWKWRDEGLVFNISGTFMEFEKGNDLAGLAAVRSLGDFSSLEEYAGNFIGGLKISTNEFKVIEKLKTSHGGIRYNCSSDSDGLKIRSSITFFLNNNKVYFVNIWMIASEWAKYEYEINYVVSNIKLSGSTDTTPSSNTQGGIYTNSEHGFQITIPPGWIFRDKNFDMVDDAIIEFNDKDNTLEGFMGYLPEMDIKTAMNGFVSGLKEEHPVFNKISDGSMPHGGIRQDYVAEEKEGNIYYVVGMVAKDKNVYCIGARIMGSSWNKYKEDINSMYNSLKFTKADTVNIDKPTYTEVQGKTWRSNRWGFEITLPEKWTMDIFDKKDGIIVAEFKESVDVYGYIMTEEFAGSCDKYIDSSIDQARKSYEIEVFKKPYGKSEADTVYSMTIEGKKYKYYLRAIDVSGKKVLFIASSSESEYDKYKSIFERHAKSLKGW